MRLLRNLDSWLTKTERGLLVILLGFMVSLAFLQVLLRTLFSMGILWGDTLLRHLVLWVGFLGAGLAASSDKQFAMDLSERLFSGRTRSAVRLLCHGFAAAVCGLLFQAAVTFWREEYSQQSVLFSIGDLKVPGWIFESIVPLGFALLLAHYLLKSAEAGLALIFGDMTENKAP